MQASSKKHCVKLPVKATHVKRAVWQSLVTRVAIVSSFILWWSYPELAWSTRLSTELPAQRSGIQPFMNIGIACLRWTTGFVVASVQHDAFCRIFADRLTLKSSAHYCSALLAKQPIRWCAARGRNPLTIRCTRCWCHDHLRMHAINNV
jgi:hypothetical protein